VSFVAIAEAWQSMTSGAGKAVPPAAKLVLLTLANCQNPETLECYPSVGYISDVTGLDQKTIRRAISMLEQAGIVVVRKVAGTSNRFDLCFSATPTNLGTTKSGTPTNSGSTNSGSTPLPVLGGETVKKQKRCTSTRSQGRKTPIPTGFSVSDSVREWAREKGFDRLDQHLEHFTDLAIAKGYSYADWDRAFQNAIRANWARLPEIKKSRGEYL